MKKLDAAPTNQSTTQTGKTSAPHKAKRPPKKYRAYLQILQAGSKGITENEILRICRLSSGRNYPTELERKLGIVFKREKEPNPDGEGSHTRYTITNRCDAYKVIVHINETAQRGGYTPLDKAEVENLLALYLPREN
ncbi:MAG TPA: hypothetical protein DEV85_04665 [Vibrio sp.]|uniref:hypothetical protein n=1 Tax=Vibrio TaxID=662 RepID=UPI000EDE3643|nr:MULTISPECIES: hypothetical protein [Vibrio]HCH01171.1 hypothetical protein [Vibrio sp.]